MKFLALVAAAISLSACTVVSVQRSDLDPADPKAAVPPVRYQPVAANTRYFVPVEPKDWTSRNAAVGPKEMHQ